MKETTDPSTTAGRQALALATPSGCQSEWHGYMGTVVCSALVPCTLTPTSRRSRRGMRRRRAPRVPRVELLSDRGIGNGHHATGLGDGVVGNELAVLSGATGTQQNQDPAA